MNIKKGLHITLWTGNLLLAVLYLLPMSELPVLLHFFGRLHPLILHFPLVMLLLALAFEIYSIKKPSWQEPAHFLLAAGAATAYISALAGFLLSAGDSYAGQTFDLHKWLGLATSWLATLLYTAKESLQSKKLFLPLFGFAALVLILTGHFGANLTHGEDFLMSAFDKKERGLPAADQAMFEAVINPILEDKCLSCHNPNKQKGGLLLSSIDMLLKGGESGKVLLPGNTADSKLISYLRLPINDDLHMPPKGKRQLTNDEIEMLSWWVASGASFEQTLGEIPTEAPVQAHLTRHFSKSAPTLDFADESTIARLNAEGIAVKAVSAASPYLEAYLGNRADLSLDDLKKLRKVSDQLYSLDLGHSLVTGRMIKEVSRHENLQRLYLDNTAITDDFLSPLRKLEKLQYLNLYGTSVTAAGIDRLLSRLPNLKNLYLWQTKISEEELAGLRTTHDQVAIDGGLSSDSFFAKTRLTPPVIRFTSVFFQDSTTIEVDYRLANASVYYQIDDGPLTELEEGRLTLHKSAKVSFLARKEGWFDSETRTETFVKINQPTAAQRSLKHAPKGAYTAKGVSTIFDLRKGSENFRDGEWLGFNGDDMVVEITLQEQQELSSVYISTLDDVGSWIFPPTQLEVWAGTSPDQMRKLSELSIESPEGPEPKHMIIHQLRFEKQGVKHLRVLAKNYGNLPEWHPGKDTPAWLFVDEIAFQ